jgi:hypothetical protein
MTIPLFLSGVCSLSQAADHICLYELGQLTLQEVLEDHNLEAKLTPILADLGIPIDSSIDNASPCYESGAKETYSFMLSDKTTIRIDLFTERILSCRPRDPEAMPEKGNAELLSEKDCTAKAHKFLRSMDYKPETDFRNMKTRKGGSMARIMAVTPGKPPAPRATLYTTTAEHVYKGVGGDFMEVTVSAHTGEIVSFRDSPLIPPKSVEPGLTAEAAIEKAKTFVMDKYLSRLEPEDITFRMREPELRISSQAERDDGAGSHLQILEEGVLVWYVPFNARYKKEDMCFLVMMDAQTGEVLNKDSAYSSLCSDE